MSAGTNYLKKVYRDHNMDGVASSGIHKPRKPEIRLGLDLVGADIAAAALAGGDLAAAIELIAPLAQSAANSEAAATGAAADARETLERVPIEVSAIIDQAVAVSQAAADAAQFGSELARDQAADLVLPANIFVADDLIAARTEGEAAVAEGIYFKAVGESEGLAEVRVRTAGGSDLLYTETTTGALASDSGMSYVAGKQSFAGAIARSLADWFDDSISVMTFIPLIERVKIRLRISTADVSDAFQKATDAAASRGGGVVRVPAGTYAAVEGIVLKEGVTYRGDGQFATILRLPVTATAHMFSAPAAPVFEGGGIHGIQLDGQQEIGAALYDGIDFSAVDSLEEYSVDLCKIHRFRRGFAGSFGSGPGNDRFPVLRHSRIWYNEVGVWSSEHAILDHIDFRWNDVGLDGRINDLYVTACKFVRNRVGAGETGTITMSWFNGCFFFRNFEVSAYLDHGTSIFGGRCDGDGGPEVGFVLRDRDNMIRGVSFGQGASTIVGGGCIRIDATLGLRFTIKDNNYYIAFGASPALTTGPLNTAVYSLNYSDNAFDTDGVKAMDLGGALLRGVITGNILTATAALPAGEAFFEWVGENAGLAPIITGNHVAYGSVQLTGHAFKGDLRGATIGMNQLVNFAGSVGAFATTHGNLANVVWGDNFGFTARRNRSVSFTAAETTKTIAHGLSPAIPLQPYHFQVTPLNNMGNATKYWVSNVTPTTFDINLDVAPGPAGAAFSWQGAVTA